MPAMIRYLWWAAWVAACILPGLALARDTLYATSLRSEVEGAHLIAGNLYVIDPSDANATLVGSILVGDQPIGIVAIATHPKTHVVYGITAGLVPRVPRSLVEIDLGNATARIIARLATAGSDIGFDNDGVLFMWAPDMHQVVRVDLENGSVAPVGMPIADAGSGAIAVDEEGHHALIAVHGAQGTLDSIDLRSGEILRGPKLHGAVYDASIDNLTFSPTGVLYAVNSNGGAPAKATLVIIEPSTGVVRRIGTLPDDVRGLIFAPERATSITRDELRTYVLAGLALIAVGLIGFAMFAHKRPYPDARA
jgi:hypothetical protein